MDQFLEQLKARMQKSLELTVTDVSSIRSGRATPALVENIKVSAYGGTTVMKLMELATITTMDAKTIVIAPYDPSIINEIAKSIQEASVGLMPNVDGEVIRIIIPPLSEERRQEYIKLVKTKIEAGRVMVRQVRHDGMTQIRKMSLDKEINEDDKKLWEKRLQDLTDSFMAQIDDLGSKKEQELLQV